MNNIKFDVEKNGAGVITGFTIKGIGDTDAEGFCISFITAQSLGKADVVFEGNEIVFKHGGITLKEANPSYGIYGSSVGGEFRAKISDEDKVALSQLLDLEGPYLRHELSVKLDLVWGKGFTLCAKPPNG
ncbi:MAG: hypothetical protein ACD_7C00492G0011 [uncultured bacterium]|nr:MAG: hypothetical protein ACD_7C00492G0011 [uncultured bacterium]HBR79343.1 hypothetical protein [Candidatus Moranbacteria bacterium]